MTQQVNCYNYISLCYNIQFQFIIVLFCMQFISEKYSDCSDGVCQIVKLKDDARCIKLIPAGDCSDHWKMTEIIASQVYIMSIALILYCMSI